MDTFLLRFYTHEGSLYSPTPCILRNYKGVEPDHYNLNHHSMGVFRGSNFDANPTTRRSDYILALYGIWVDCIPLYKKRVYLHRDRAVCRHYFSGATNLGSFLVHPGYSVFYLGVPLLISG